jgi:photosystem II stability/assembly factor-like uncharacterized protein
MNITGCCQLQASLSSANNWNLNFNIGARAQAGVEISLLGFDLSYDTDIFCVKEKLFSLNNEPFGNSIVITKPNNNASLVLGNAVKIETEIIGDNPSEVKFLIDGNLLFTDTEAPYTYTWETSNSSKGTHSIEVKEIINGNEVSQDKINVELGTAGWSAIDLSQYGVSEYAVISQVTFLDDNNGWIFVKSNDRTGNVSSGFVLITHDGGITWEKQNEGKHNSGMSEVVVLNENHLYGRCGNFVYESSNGGRDFSTIPLKYCPGDPPIPDNCQPGVTFPFDVEGIAMNAKGELVAAGIYLHLAAAETDFIIRRARTSDNDPTGRYKTQDYSPHFGDFTKILFKNHFGITYNIGRQSDEKPVYLISTDDGLTWTEYPATFQTATGRDTYAYDAFFWDENTGWIVGGTHFFHNGYIAKTTDGGKTFTKTKFYDIGVVIEGGTSAGAVCFVSPDEGYVGFRHFPNSLPKAQNMIYHTVDGGETWSPVQEIVRDEGINDIFFLGTKFGWAVGDGNIIYKYTDE